MDEFNMLNFDMSLAPGRTYRYFTGQPLYPFGWGLSYTTFSLAWASLPPPTIVLDIASTNSTTLSFVM